MKLIKKVFRLLLIILVIPVIYLLIALILTYIPIAEEEDDTIKDSVIYLTTNGVHLDIVLPKDRMSHQLLKGLKYNAATQYFAFGWGEEDFYLNTPAWSDLTFSTAFKAAFLDNNTLVHITRYAKPREKWVAVPVSQKQLIALNTFLQESFAVNEYDHKQRIPHQSYGPRDDFYKAHGRYSYRKTCNSWVNTGLKESGMKGALWTPFDFGVLRRYY